MGVCAIADLYDRHGARLYRYALLLVGDPSAAEDVVQDAFYRLTRAGRRTDDIETLAYLTRIVRNECYSLLRKRRRQPVGAALLLEPAAPDASEEERLIVEAALRALPSEQRETVYLKVFEGLTFQEIGSQCGVSVNTAASRYRYGLAALRTHLRTDGSRT